MRTCFDYAFANYSVKPIVEVNNPLEVRANVNAGKVKEVSIIPNKTSYALMCRGEKFNYTQEIHLKMLCAPLNKGNTIGEMVIYKDGIEIDRVSLLAGEDVAKANLFDRMKTIGKSWNSRRKS